MYNGSVFRLTDLGTATELSTSVPEPGTEEEPKFSVSVLVLGFWFGSRLYLLRPKGRCGNGRGVQSGPGSVFFPSGAWDGELNTECSSIESLLDGAFFLFLFLFLT
jgi:hypothetical protein